MYSTELIKKFPADPDSPILFFVYNKEMVSEAEFLISVIHGQEYLDKYVTVLPIGTDEARLKQNSNNVSIYIDPTVFSMRTNGYN